MVLGGVRIPRMLTSEHFTFIKGPKSLLNRKRSAALIAKNTTNPAPSTQQQLPAHKRKKQANIPDPNQFSNSSARLTTILG